MRRFITFRSLLVLSIVLLWPQMSEAASVSEILGKARQANARARGLKNGSVDDKVQAIQILGPVTLEFVGASDLAHAAKSQRSTVRETCDTLKDPLEDIYNSAFSQINSMSKSVMDQDGDLEALYETKAWKDSQLVASQSLYFLNWLRYICSFVENSKQRKEMLQKAADGFSEFAVGEQGSQLKRESLFGRALAEKELRQYDWAIRDFEILLKDPGLPRDMEQKVRSSLADARSRRAKGGGQKDEDEGPSEPSPDDIAKAMLDKAQSLFDRSQRERGDKREKTRWEGIAYIEEVRKKGGEWEKRADALAKREMTAQETAQLEEEKNPFVPWKQATEYLQKNQYSRAIPLLKEVVASDDARAKAHRKEALYFLSVGHFQQADYRAALARLDDFFAKDGVPQQYADDAAYLRFKSAEALYASTKTPSEATIKLYVDATKNYIRRYPNHKSVFEAYFRLGEYEHSQKNYLAAAEQYQKVKGDLPFQVRADYAELQSYFALQDALDQKKKIDISETELRSRIVKALQSFQKNVAALEQNPSQARQIKELKEWRGNVVFLNAVFLGKDMDANAEQLVTLLQDFEKKYPEQPQSALESVARTRLIVLEKTGRLAELEKEVERIFAVYKGEQQQELLKGLGPVLVRDIDELEKQNDKDKALIAKRTLTKLYAKQLERGDAVAAGESPDKFKYDLAQLYLDVKEYDKATQIYQELRPGVYGAASLAGLAQVAAVTGETTQALALWKEMLKSSQVGDPLWFRGTYEVAQLQATQGDKEQSCKTISAAFVMVNRVGDPGLRKKIQDLSLQSCKK